MRDSHLARGAGRREMPHSRARSERLLSWAPSIFSGRRGAPQFPAARHRLERAAKPRSELWEWIGAIHTRGTLHHSEGFAQHSARLGLIREDLREGLRVGQTWMIALGALDDKISQLMLVDGVRMIVFHDRFCDRANSVALRNISQLIGRVHSGGVL